MTGPRGQTTLDFAIGISVFLAVLVFVFTFVPGMLQPFTASAEDDTVLADRLADNLSQGGLGDPAEPYVLNETTTRDFFDSSSELYERLNVKSRTNVNVTLEGNVTASVNGSTALCLNGTTLGQIGSSTCTGSVVPLRDGGIPPEDDDASVTARRVVSLDGTDATLKVVVW